MRPFGSLLQFVGTILNSLRETTVSLFVIFLGDSPVSCQVDCEIEIRIGTQPSMVYAFLSEEAAGRVLEELPGLLDLDTERVASLHLREYRLW